MKMPSIHSRASVLVGLLWCIALLSVVVVGALRMSQRDLKAVKNHGDLVQAHYLALAGIEYTKALVYQDRLTRQRSFKNHTGALYNQAQLFRDIPLGRGRFRVFREGVEQEGNSIVYGLSDEERYLNANSASAEELGKLPGVSPEIVSAIQDWRDTDSQTTPNGAENEYYASLKPPYLAKNGPFETIRELLMVRGINRELLFGEDANYNGLLDREEDDGSNSFPPDNANHMLDAGWSALLTTHSINENTAASGEDRVNVQSAEESDLTAIPGISSDLAKAIIAHRNQNKYGSIADLLDVRAPGPQNRSASGTMPVVNMEPVQNTAPPQPGPGERSGSPAPAGENLISNELLISIADYLTVSGDQEISGLVNINTASATVLGMLSGMNAQLAEAIVAYRQSAGFFDNIA